MANTALQNLEVKFTLQAKNGEDIYVTKGGKILTPDEHREKVEAEQAKEDSK